MISPKDFSLSEQRAYLAGYISGLAVQARAEQNRAAGGAAWAASLWQAVRSLRDLLVSGSPASLDEFLQATWEEHQSFGASAADPRDEASSSLLPKSPEPAVVPITSAPRPGAGEGGL